MDGLFHYLTDTENEGVVSILLVLAALRILLEFFKPNLHRLPITQKLERNCSFFHGKAFHRTGLYLGIGYILLFIPTLIQM